MFSVGKKRFTGGFLFIQKKAALMQMAARSIKNRAGFAGLFRGGLRARALAPLPTAPGGWQPSPGATLQRRTFGSVMSKQVWS